MGKEHLLLKEMTEIFRIEALGGSDGREALCPILSFSSFDHDRTLAFLADLWFYAHLLHSSL